MFVHVKLLNGFSRTLTYKVPVDFNKNLIGAIVQVPLKNTLQPAVVVAQVSSVSQTFIIKEIHSLQEMPNDERYSAYLEQLSNYYQIDSLHFIKRIRNFLKEESKIDRAVDHAPECVKNTLLTSAQETIASAIKKCIGTDTFFPSLLHGVTGSGKTEVYKALIKDAIEKQLTGILLLPEVSLALQFEQLLKIQLPEVPIFGFHSGSKTKEKNNAWQQLIEKKPLLLIGVHLPVLLPVSNLGLIIVDEEHELGYQEKKHPKINSKEAALFRAQHYKIPIVLGSATPSITSLYNVKNKRWHFFELTDRFSGKFPTIKIVSLIEKKEQRKQFWISKELEEAIHNRLYKKEQVIIFLNRRGYSFFVQCKQCSFIFECATCSVSLTLHNTNDLTCHYCGFSRPLPFACDGCKSSKDLLKKGIGTQQVVTILEQLFPAAKIARADMDVSSKKKVWQQTLDNFHNGVIDILVGTQTITKGFHFPNVTLVGVLWADLNLHFPMYNASEVSLQQLIQVAGRAGRTGKESLVIIQTMAQHALFDFLNEENYLKYYHYEVKNRELVQYPPFIRLVEIELKNSDEQIISQEAHLLATQFLTSIKKHQFAITVLGPAKPPVAKVKSIFSRKIYLKGDSFKQIIMLYQSINKAPFKSNIFFTPNPS